jgi:hypothetical protein
MCTSSDINVLVLILIEVAAVAHNSAMYLAHRCVLLGFLYRERLPALAPHSLTFIDIVPRSVSSTRFNIVEGT